MSAFNELTGNSGGKHWCIGYAAVDILSMHLVPVSGVPLITAADLGDDYDFVADPFRCALGSRTFVFAEAWSRSAKRGRIAAFELDDSMQIRSRAVVLAEPFHLSYPCVFRYRGSHYMLPEAWESRELRLYRATTFPWEWEFCKVLLELDYADPQVVVHQGIWYCFLNTDPITNACASVFWTESPLEPWRAHARNPVVTGDGALARSAGPPLRRKDRIVRFSQDCRDGYGQGVVASEIAKLTPSEFRTAPIGPVGLDRPAWARDGFHHLDLHVRDGSHYALFDGYTVSGPRMQEVEPERT